MKTLLALLLISSTAFADNSILSSNAFSELNKTLNILSENLIHDVSFDYLEGKKARKELRDLKCSVKPKASSEVMMYFINLIYNASVYLPDNAYSQLDIDRTNLEFEELINGKKVKYCYFNGSTFDKVEYLYVRHTEMEFSIRFSELNIY